MHGLEGCALFMEESMPSSSQPRRFGAWVEALLLIGVLVVVGVGVMVLNTRQVDRATDVTAEG